MKIKLITNHKTTVVKKIFIPIGILSLIFIFTIVLQYLKGIFIDEPEDDKVLGYVYGVTLKLREFYAQKKRFPQSLGEIGVNDKYCFQQHCFDIYYQPIIDDNTDYTIAVGVNYPFIAYATSLECGGRKGCSGYAVVEDYWRSKKPIYRKDPEIFKNPDYWPKINTGSWFHRLVYSIFRQ